jgi:hypothetical protein
VNASLDTAVLGLRRLESNARRGQSGLVTEVRDSLVAEGERIHDAAHQLSLWEPATLGDIDLNLYKAIESMRARRVTPKAEAEEIVHLFAGIDAMSIVAEGLRRASAALRS